MISFLCTANPPPRPGAVVNLTAALDPDHGAVTLQWSQPLSNGNRVTGYDIRFKQVGADHYTPLRTVPSDCLTVRLRPEDGIAPLSRCNFDVRARINEVVGQWSGLIQYVGEPLEQVHTLARGSRVLHHRYYTYGSIVSMTPPCDVLHPAASGHSSNEPSTQYVITLHRVCTHAYIAFKSRTMCVCAHTM